jgi:hypothetical protein
VRPQSLSAYLVAGLQMAKHLCLGRIQIAAPASIKDRLVFI